MKKITTIPSATVPAEIKENHYAVIMAGGSGTRLWPMSRKSSPKQFQALVSHQTMLQLMYQLLREVFTPSRILVQTAKSFKGLVETQLPELPLENILLEPEARDTAPAFGFATAEILKRDKEAKLGIFYSDHIIKNREEFVKAVKTSYQAVEDFPDYVVMMGVKPAYAHTGLGYIQMNSQVKAYDDGEVFNVERFIEKPDALTATEFVKSWEYFWNTGYKVCTASALFDLIAKHAPEMAETLQTIAHLAEEDSPKAEAKIAELYGGLEKISFEYLIVERLDNLLVVPSDMEWSDIGDWKSLHDILTQVSGHHVVTKGEHVGVDMENSLVYAGDRLVATLGLKDVVVVDTPDVLLIANKHKVQDLKKLITQLEEQNKHTYL